MSEMEAERNRGIAVVGGQESEAPLNYGRILVQPERCQGCRTCEMYCSLKNYGEVNPARARIHMVKTVENGVISTVPVVCQQCEDPMCMEMCPASAISRHPETHAVVVDPDKCLGCRTCVEVCPFGAPHVDPRTGKSEKCDLCGGDPTCVKYCSFFAIKYVVAEEESISRRRDMLGKYLDHVRTGGAKMVNPAKS